MQLLQTLRAARSSLDYHKLIEAIEHAILGLMEQSECFSVRQPQPIIGSFLVGAYNGTRNHFSRSEVSHRSANRRSGFRRASRGWDWLGLRLHQGHPGYLLGSCGSAIPSGRSTQGGRLDRARGDHSPDRRRVHHDEVLKVPAPKVIIGLAQTSTRRAREVDPDTAIGGPHAHFPSTQLSLLEATATGLSSEALDRVIALYWKPVYHFIRLKFRTSFVP